MRKVKEFIEDKVNKVDRFLVERERKIQEKEATRKLKERLDRGSLSMEAKEAKEELKELKLAEKDKKVLKELREYKEKTKPKPFENFNKGDIYIDFEGYPKRIDKMFDTGDMFKQPKKKKGDGEWTL